MLTFDDLSVGDRFAGRLTVTVTADDIRAFAGAYDPQPFHLDDEAARASVFGGLVASGWHTAALTMRMIVAGDPVLAGGHVGLGMEELAWPAAVRPGDTLRIESEVLGLRSSASRPENGIATIRTVTFNQKDEPVQRLTARLLVSRRLQSSTPSGRG